MNILGMNYRNGTKPKCVCSKYGRGDVDMPQDRQSSFEPQVISKCKKEISVIDDKIIAMYAKSIITRQISDTIEDINGFAVSESIVSNITIRLLCQRHGKDKKGCIFGTGNRRI